MSTSYLHQQGERKPPEATASWHGNVQWCRTSLCRRKSTRARGEGQRRFCHVRQERERDGRGRATRHKAWEFEKDSREELANAWPPQFVLSPARSPFVLHTAMLWNQLGNRFIFVFAFCRLKARGGNLPQPHLRGPPVQNSWGLALCATCRRSDLDRRATDLCMVLSGHQAGHDRRHVEIPE